MPSQSPMSNRSRSPEAMKSDSEASAQARTASSSGSRVTTGSMNGGSITAATDAKPRTTPLTETSASRSRRVNFARCKTSSSSARSSGLVKISTIPSRAASSSRRAGPCQRTPEITTFVSRTTRTIWPAEPHGLPRPRTGSRPQTSILHPGLRGGRRLHRT